MVFILSVVGTLVAFFVWQRATKQVRHNAIVYRPIARGSILAAGVFGVLALLQFFTKIPAGHVGVVDFFGVVSDNTLRAGVNTVNPMEKVIKYSIQTLRWKGIEATEKIASSPNTRVIIVGAGKDGLPVILDTQ